MTGSNTSRNATSTNVDHNRARISEAPHCNLNLGRAGYRSVGSMKGRLGASVIEPAERYTASPYFGKHYGTEYDLEQYLNNRREDLFENDGPCGEAALILRPAPASQTSIIT